MNTQQYILSIAGFDPSSGAGLTSDIKTFQYFGLYGFSVCTTVTVQNDIDFKESNWIDSRVIISQIETLFDRFEINFVKIGIVENWQTLFVIVNKLKQLNPVIKIVLDPVLKTSSGYDFHNGSNEKTLDSVLKKTYLITPNFEEIQRLYPEKSIEETIQSIRQKTNLYLKGGHRTDKVGLDQLFFHKTGQLNIEPSELKVSPKHGSGCVLASALASNLALGFSLQDASKRSKKYIEQFLSSNETLLGDHTILN